MDRVPQTQSKNLFFHPDVSLRLNPQTDSCISSSHGQKRKWSAANGGIPASVSSMKETVCTVSSTKETDEEFVSMDLLGFDFQLCLGQSRKENLYPCKKKPFDFDLNLSLPSNELHDSVNVTPKNQSFSDFERPDERHSATYSAISNGVNNAGTCYNKIDPKKVDPALAVSVSDVRSTLVDLDPQTMSSTVVSGTSSQKRCTSTKTCQIMGCTRGARGASGRCISHGGGRRCQRPGCPRGAEGKTIFCKSHGGGRRCTFLGCTKSAEGKTDFCIGHGGGRRCGHADGCTRAARGKSGLCIRHGGGKRCSESGCVRSAEGQSGLCISHGGGRRCQFLNCTKGAQGSTNLCKAHGGGKRCTFSGCNKGAEGSTQLCKAHGGGKRCGFLGGCSKSVHGGTPFCVAHGGGKRCGVTGCTRSARGRTEFCVRHGGGKRCKELNCGKSAQGSTEFCKAHGGGKRCAWGRIGDGEPGCGKVARGRTGMCGAHGALVKDECVHGGRLEIEPVLVETERKVKEVGLPEGRVHGGSLMALLSMKSPSGTDNMQLSWF